MSALTDQNSFMVCAYNSVIPISIDVRKVILSFSIIFFYFHFYNRKSAGHCKSEKRICHWKIDTDKTLDVTSMTLHDDNGSQAKTSQAVDLLNPTTLLVTQLDSPTHRVYFWNDLKTKG